MKKGWPLVISLLVFVGFAYGAVWLLLMPNASFSMLQVEGALLMIPAVLWWLIALIRLAREQRWVWFTTFLLCLPVAPLATLAYDMNALRAEAA